MLISLTGTWIQVIALSWLVFELTNSAFLLGLVGFLGSLPVFFFSLFGGVVADRIDKRIILVCTQSAFMILAFVLGILTQTKIITPLYIMVIALLDGIVMAFDAPSRQAIVVELVGKQHLLNAIALNSAAFNSARIIGPALAGILVAAIGMSGCFYINGISFLAVIIALLLMRLNKGQKKEGKTFFIKDLRVGLKFMKQNTFIKVMLSMVAITSLFGISYVMLMPIFANEILKVGSRGLGILMSAAGVGALAAALILAALGDFRYKVKLLIFSFFIFPLALGLFSLSKIYLFSLATLVLIGWASVTAISLINTLLQTLVPDEFRGRVMSVFMLTFAGMMPFGNLIAGGLAQILGVQLAVFIGSAICFLFFIFIYLIFFRKVLE